MNIEHIKILKAVAKEQTISVRYYPNGKVYRIPMATFFLGLETEDDDMSLYVDCDYAMQYGVMFVRCSVCDAYGNLFVTPVVIPLDKKKQNKLQQEFLSLINLCSKRVIAQEISRKKYAINSAISSISVGKEYS